MQEAFKIDNTAKAGGGLSNSFSKKMKSFKKLGKNIREASNKFQSFLNDDGEMEEEKSDPDEDSKVSEKEEEQDQGFMARMFGKMKKAFTWENMLDFVVGDYFEKEEEFEIDYHFENDALDNGLSFTKMSKVVEKRLPKDKKNEPFPVCKTNSGWHCCVKRWRKTDMAELGIGLSLYFKMIKFFITLFGILTVISIPLFVYFTDGDGLCSST